MDILCKIPTYDRLSDNYPSFIHDITIKSIDNIDKHGFIYITINDNTTILVDGKELIDGIQRCLI